MQGVNTFKIQGINNDGSDAKILVVNYQPRQSPPIVNISYPAMNPYTTSTDQININASILNVPSRSNVVFTVNGQASNNFTFTGTSFAATGVSLYPGSNTIMISATNNSGQDSKSVQIIYNKVQEVPVVSITQPVANPSTTDVSTASILATITNVSGPQNVTFSVNGQNSSNFSLNGTVFSSSLNLNEGSNAIVISAYNEAGSGSDSRVIIYNKKQLVLAPMITINTPAISPYTTGNDVATVQATILNVTDRANITCTINGYQTDAFNFSGQFFSLNNINLNPGNNAITISAVNSAGQDTKSTIIVFNQPILAPTIRITAPGQNPWTSPVDKVNVTAICQNVSSASQLSFSVNGQPNSNFSLNGTAFKANNVALVNGSNVLTITASTSGGQATASTVVIYNQPVVVPAPTIRITAPGQNPWTSPNPKVNVTAICQNVSNASQLSFSVNGQPNSNFSLNGTAFKANNVALVNGSNVLTITASTSGGQATASTVVIYNQPVVVPAPTIRITAPGQNPWTSPNPKVNVTAICQNVSSASQLSFSVNGQPNSNFSLNGTAFKANNVALVNGSNVLTITASTSGGQATASTVVIYNQPVVVPAPELRIVSPAAATWNSPVNKVNVTAIIKNVSNSSGIIFRLNGDPYTNFKFNGNALVATAVPLNVGNNTIDIIATNATGQISDSRVVIYQGSNNGGGNGNNSGANNGGGNGNKSGSNNGGGNGNNSGVNNGGGNGNNSGVNNGGGNGNNSGVNNGGGKGNNSGTNNGGGNGNNSGANNGGGNGNNSGSNNGGGSNKSDRGSKGNKNVEKESPNESSGDRAAGKNSRSPK